MTFGVVRKGAVVVKPCLETLEGLRHDTHFVRLLCTTSGQQQEGLKQKAPESVKNQGLRCMAVKKGFELNDSQCHMAGPYGPFRPNSSTIE